MLSFRLLRSNMIVDHCFNLGCVFSTPYTVRGMALVANKHWDPRWRKFRALKVVKIDLPDFHKERKSLDELTQDEMRSHFKEFGLQPVRPWEEKPFSLDSTPGVVDQYVPPEGDGKISALNSAGAKQKMEWLKKKGTSWKDLRAIRKYDEDFELYPDFVDEAQDIYIKSHELLAKGDTEDLLRYVTEKAYPIMVRNCNRKTIRWSFVKSLEPPRVCHVRKMEILTKSNVFAQITVRFHTQQILAVYDRFGRLMHGSETVAKDVLEYVVFEKHIASHYGTWRVHHKILPEWVEHLSPVRRTYVETEEEICQDDNSEEIAEQFVKVPQ